MSRRYCYWTLASGDYAGMARQLVASARQAGVSEDFHIWTDEEIQGAVCHRLGLSEINGRHFKFTYLREYVQRLDYDYFIWLDADSYFVRNPGDPLRCMQRSPLHVPLEDKIVAPEIQNESWCGCAWHRLTELMRDRGVRGHQVHRAGGGMFMVHREFVETLLTLTKSFYFFCKTNGALLGGAPLLAYAMQMVCGDRARHLLARNLDLWCPDHRGLFRDRLPEGEAWEYRNPSDGVTSLVNPAIVHLARSRHVGVDNGGSRERMSCSKE